MATDRGVKRPTEALISSNLFEIGIGYVVVARFKSSGAAEVGVFLVDTYCLGVKDGFFESFDRADEYLKLQVTLFSEPPKTMTPESARRLVESAVAYAASLGFAPARDYKKACRVFGGIDASRSTETFVFGCDGQPFYSAGPNETPAERQRILRVLEGKCGPGNFGYLLEDEEEEEYDFESSVDASGEDDAGITDEGRAAFLAELQEKAGVPLKLSEGGPKISDRLMAVAEPYLEECRTAEDRKMIASAAMLAWNLGGGYNEELTKEVQKVYATMPQEIAPMVNVLIARRRELYPDDNRFVVQAAIQSRANGKLAFIAASLRPGDEPVK